METNEVTVTWLKIWIKIYQIINMFSFMTLTFEFFDFDNRPW